MQSPQTRTRIRRLATIAAAALLTPLLAFIGTIALHAFGNWDAPIVAELALPAPERPAHDRRIAVVVSGAEGAEMTDFLLPLEVLARSGAFETYVVAPERRIVPLASVVSRDGGLDLVPNYSFDEYDALVGRAPDVIVVPYLPAFEARREPAVVPWIRRQATPPTLVLSICAGAEVVAAAGLFDGMEATTHPSVFDRLLLKYPKVRWIRDVRFVENARGIASGAVASGMDASLAAVQRLVGRDAAERVARELGYAHLHFLDAPAWTGGGRDLRAALNVAWRPSASTVGVMLDDGIGEAVLGSVFDTFPPGDELVAIAPERRPIRTRHGVLLVPRHAFAGAPKLDRMLVPGRPSEPALSAARALADAHGAVTTVLHTSLNAFPYDDALRDIAARDSAFIAESVAWNLNYPTTHLTLEGAAFPARLVVAPLVLALVAALAAFALTRRT